VTSSASRGLRLHIREAHLPCIRCACQVQTVELSKLFENVPHSYLFRSVPFSNCFGFVLCWVDTGDGVDDIYYAPATNLLYFGAPRAGKLTIAHTGDNGLLSILAQVPTREGARNGVLAPNGTLYLAHSGLTKLSALIVVSPSGK